MLRTTFAICLVLFFSASVTAQTLVVREGTGVNLREGPGTNHAVLELLPSGEELEQTGRMGEWIQTKYGWVHGDFVDRKDLVMSPRAPLVSLGLAQGLKDEIGGIARSPDGQLLATLNETREVVQFWDYITGEELNNVSFQETATGLSFLSDDKLILYNKEGLTLLDVPSLSPVYRGNIPLGRIVLEAGNYLMGHSKLAAHIFDVTTFETLNTTYIAGMSPQDILLGFLAGEIDVSAFSTLSSEAFDDFIVGGFLDEDSGHYFFYVTVLDSENGHQLQIRDMNKRIVSSRNTGEIAYIRVFHETGRGYGTSQVHASDSSVYLFDIETGTNLLRVVGAPGDLHHTTASPNGRYFLNPVISLEYMLGWTRIHDLDDGVSRILTFDGRLQGYGQHTPVFDDGTFILPVIYSYQENSLQIWKVDLSVIFSIPDETIKLSDTHPAVTVFGAGFVSYQPIEAAIQDMTGAIRFESSLNTISWFDPAKMAVATQDTNLLQGATLAYRDRDEFLRYISSSGVDEYDKSRMSYIVGEPLKEYSLHSIAFAGVEQDRSDVIPSLTSQWDWNKYSSVEGDEGFHVFGEILQGADGYSYALPPRDMRGLMVSPPDKWPNWSLQSEIYPITSGIFRHEINWVKSRTGKAFLAIHADGRPGTYFTDGRGFIAFGEKIIEELDEFYKDKINWESADRTVKRELDFLYLDNGDIVVFSDNRRDCVEAILINSESEWIGRNFIPNNEKLCFMDYRGFFSSIEAIDDHRFLYFDSDLIIIVNTKTGEISLDISVENVESVSGSADGRHLYALKTDGTVDILSSLNGKRLATFHVFSDASWLIMTPEGFYTAGEGGDEHLRVMQGLSNAFSIAKFRDSLYRPDLVAEALNGDPEGVLRTAAETVSLERILLSGSAPAIMVSGLREGEVYTASARIEDQGGGIGRLEWRVNGIAQQSAIGNTEFNASLFLAEGENRIELVAYNRENTIQGRSTPLHVTVESEELGKPRLYILALGVNDYALDTISLRYAENDAATLADAFARAGQGLYSEVFTHLLVNEDVTRQKLEQTFATLAETIRPNDVFLFFSAGHGITLDGRYFFIPQDISATNVGTIRQEGIGHAQWQEWFSMIPAQKSLLLFDTCESGSLAESLVGRDLRFRSAADLLGNATGRALLSASSSTEVAWEGYEGHGIFTYSILQALETADRNADGVIDIDELASVIQEVVPDIAAEVWNERQTPQFKAPQVSFAVAEPLAVQH